MQAGRLPLWNPYLFAGAPLLANSQAGIFYPLNWPLWMLSGPSLNGMARTLHWSVVLHLLLAAFTPEDLRRFCRDRAEFQPVVARFGPGQGQDDMVDRVIDHCRTQLLWDELLTQVAQINPRQYSRFESHLYG